MLKVLLIGDSIRLSYRAKVATLLEGRANVLGPEENCRFSAYTLFFLQDWAKDDDYDVIQWNNGQWDTCYMPDGSIHTSLPAYLELQKRIAGILQKKTKRLIFATTTPVWPEQFEKAVYHPRKNEDIIEYNASVSKLLKSLNVEINDLHSAVAADIHHYISSDMVHLTETGQDLCAGKTASMINPEMVQG